MFLKHVILDFPSLENCVELVIKIKDEGPRYVVTDKTRR